MTTISQDNALLLLVEVYVLIIGHRLSANRVFIKEALYRLPIPQMGLGDLWDIFNTYMSIKDAFRLDKSNGTLFAEAVAAGEIHLDTI
jgi:uncharacterized membrane protein YpjA